MNIQPDAPVFDVRHIQRNIAIEGWILACLYLPQAGDARGHIESAQVAQLVLAHLAADGWPWTNNTHLAAQHIEELGQLVERILAQEAAQPGNAWIVADLEQHALALVQVHYAGAPFFRIANHSPKFDAAKDVALLADAL